MTFQSQSFDTQSRVSMFGVVCLAWVVCASVTNVACGGSSDEDKPSTASQAGAAAVAVALPAHTAGKPCGASKDCGSGVCRTDLPGGLAMGFQAQPAPGGYCSASCKVPADCGEGGVCGNPSGGNFFGGSGGASGAICLAGCTSSSECREGYRCVDLGGEAVDGSASSTSGTCQVTPSTDSLSGAIVGSACGEDAECGGGRCLKTSFGSSYPGGYCTGRCLEQNDCGDKAICDGAFAGGTGTCYRSCESDADCGRDGYRCRGGLGGAARRCTPGAAPLPNGKVGNACASDTDCGGAAMSCARQVMTFNGSQTFADGYCTLACIEDIDCGTAGTCIGALPALRSGLATGCYKTCTVATDCRTGYRCAAVSVGAGGAATNTAEQRHVCAPPVPESGADAGTDAG